MSGLINKIKDHIHEHRSNAVDSNTPMPKATAKVNGVVVAESDNYEFVEGNIYFPPSYVP